jgi:MFS family permease
MVQRLPALVGAIVFLDTMFFAALTPLLPHYADRFDLSKAGAGVLQAAYPAGVLVGSLPSGFATVRLGARTTAVTGLVLMAATTLTFGLADNVYMLDGARFGQGLVSACAWTAGFSWLVSWAPAGRRGKLIGAAMATAIVGALFGPVAGGLASVAGTAKIFGAIGAIALLLAMWAATTEEPARTAAQPVGGFARAVGDGPLVAGIWFVTLPALLFGTLSVLAPLRLSERGLSAIAIGAVWLISAAFEAIANPIVGRISDRRGRRRPIVAGLAASAVIAALLPWPDERILLALLVVVGSIAFSLFWVPAMSLITDRSERLGLPYGFGFALVNLAWAPGQALGSSGGGAIAGATSDAVPYLVLAGVCVLTLVALSGSGDRSRTPAVAPTVRETLGEEERHGTQVSR